MILRDVLDYLKQHRSVTLKELANHFDTEPEALRGMLALLVVKNKIQKVSANNACGTSCCKCDNALTEIYQIV